MIFLVATYINVIILHLPLPILMGQWKDSDVLKELFSENSNFSEEM